MMSINNLPRFYVLSAFAFLVFLFFGYDSLFGSTTIELTKVDTSSEVIVARLSRALAELNSLKAQNEELRSLLNSFIPNKQHAALYLTDDETVSNNVHKSPKVDDYRSQNAISRTENSFPTQEYEFAHRKLQTDIQELWNFVRNESDPSRRLFLRELKDSLLFDLDIVRQRDNNWRRRELEDLGNIVQSLLFKLQHPEDCSKARKLVCHLNKGCGFGCQMHHVVYCTIVAMATERTLILNSKSWRYVTPNQRQSRSLWDAAFQPLSSNCVDSSGGVPSNWGAQTEDTQVVFLPIVDSLREKLDYLPPAIPEKIADRLSRVHGAPNVWFIGQILKYLLRPSKEVEDFLDEKRKEFAFERPIVGVHVRRTDKIATEASFHALSEYMQYVEEYYDRLELWNARRNVREPIKRRVYLATDDVSVWKQEVPLFEKKGYIFIGDSQISTSASIRKRYSFDSLKNVILDTWMLSETDFLVCTFSSQICRLSYEIMQAHNNSLDRSADFKSLDDIFYFGGQNGHDQIAILDHKESNDRSEIEIRAGDVIGIAGNHWNGFSKGINRRTDKTGLYPGFKTKEKSVTAFFKLFQNAKHYNIDL